MKKTSSKSKANASISLRNIVLRYLVLLLIVLLLSFSSFFYNILLNLTLHPSAFILNIFYDTLVYRDMIFLEKSVIQIIPACVAVSAYILLIILNLSTKMNALQRFYSLGFSILLLLFVNISRISAFSAMLANDFSYFDFMHKIFWYFLSIVLVAGIWFFSVYLFKIKEIPVYSDFKYLLSLIKSSLKNK